MQFTRHELKYYINDIQMEGLIAQLSEVMEIDPHCDGLNGYRVRSLYFDSINDECLYQKQSGILKRAKVRLRTYGERDSEITRLEIKRKNNQQIKKNSVPVSRTLAEDMMDGDYSPLLSLEHPDSDRVYTTFVTRLYQPKVIVEYQRLAFVYPLSNTRITFDTHLHSNVSHTDLYSSVRDCMPVTLNDKQIMEVKFEQQLPAHLGKLLSSLASERTAISKYTLARRFNKSRSWEDN